MLRTTVLQSIVSSYCLLPIHLQTLATNPCKLFIHFIESDRRAHACEGSVVCNAMSSMSSIDMLLDKLHSPLFVLQMITTHAFNEICHERRNICDFNVASKQFGV